MKRLLICLVALIAVFALVMPTSAAEMKVSGIWFAKANHRDNFDGDDDNDDSTSYVTQRFRSYWHFIANENLRLVYKNEIDFEWGDSAGDDATRGSGGGASGDAVNLETKNVYLEFMVPDTPVKATLGLQGITLHKGWFVSDDLAAARFDMNFDPVSITTYWAGLSGLEADEQTETGTVSNDASDDWWQIVASGAYKAENMDARLSFAYERRPNDTASTDVPKSDELFLLMGELDMSFDVVSFFLIGGANFGGVDSENSTQDRDYSGYMFHAGVNFALDMANLRAQFIYTSGDDEKFSDLDGDGTAEPVPQDDDFQGLRGETFSWAEIVSDGYTYDRSANLTQIGGLNTPSNMWAVGAGVDLMPTDTTTFKIDAYYIGMVEDRSVGCNPTLGESCDEDEIGIEVDASLTQKIYDNLSLTLLGAYLFAEDGYGIYGDKDRDSDTPTTYSDNSGDNAFQLVIGLDFKF